MGTLSLFVILYILFTISIGLYASRKIAGSSDFVLAGRSLPLYVTIATVFATWFGSEAVLGIPSTFIEEGMGGIVADPFGAGLCLIFVGLFFAARLYRMKLLTIGDFYKRKFGRTVELLVSVAICISYLGWVAAQVVALGLIIQIVSGDAIPFTLAMVVGITAVVIYTVIGGMWAVAYTDFIQMMMILVGLIAVAILVAMNVEGGATAVIQEAKNQNRFDFWPEWNMAAILGFVGTFITLALGSIPQQDVFQRVMSARSEKTAVIGTVLGGSFYIIFCFVPIFIVFGASMIDPALVEGHMAEGGDTQRILPEFILGRAPIVIQILFFGALLSAIMSTASGTLLAPSAILAENILKPVWNLKDKSLLLALRLCVLGFAVVVLGYAYLSASAGLSIFEMVENAYLLPLCGAFVPLVFGIYWSKSSKAGALASIFCGVGSWAVLEVLAFQAAANDMDLMIVPPQLAGVIIAALAMVVGSLVRPDTIKPEE